MRILALDPGFDRLGIAILEREKNGTKETLIFSECFQTNKKESLSKRIFAIGNELEQVITKYTPEVCASESLFFAKNQKTAIDVASSRGVLLYIAEKYNLPLYEYTPLQIKIAVTGYGRSDKSQVTNMVRRIIQIDKKITIDDEFDAIAVGLTCFAIEKF